MIPGFLFVDKYKKKRNVKLNFQNNRLSKSLTDKLYKIGRDKIIHTLENTILNWLIHVRISNLHNYFNSETF